MGKRARREFGSIRKRASDRWEASYHGPDGRRISLGTFATFSDADFALANVEVNLRRGIWIDPRAARIPFCKIANEWAATTFDLRPSSRLRDLGYLNRYILPRFGTTDLADIEHRAIQGWVVDLDAKNLAPATVKIAGQIMGKILASAVRTGRIPSNPAEGIRYPRNERREMRFLTAAEVLALVETMDHRYQAAILVSAFGGLRVGELWGLRRSRVDLVRRSLSVCEILTEAEGHLFAGPPKTRAGRRMVPLPRVAVEALGAHMAAHPGEPEEYVFRAPSGGPVRLASWRTRFWTPAVRKAGLVPLRPHDLRHTAVALWIAAEASPKEVAVRAGHTSVAFTLDRYGHLFPGHEEKVNNALDSMAESARHRAHGAPTTAVAEGPSNEKRALTLVDGGGASWNRTSDLSIISAAL